ncbi:MAG TPA: aldo/keto reductase, partial [Stellaceae bacterium]|nr:aldo/keto reductase [Stellaceae bacterium]
MSATYHAPSALELSSSLHVTLLYDEFCVNVFPTAGRTRSRGPSGCAERKKKPAKGGEMPEIEFRAVTSAGLKVTTMGLGGTGLGNMYNAISVDAATATVHAAYDRGIRYFDTAPVYGFGLSETRLGQAIKSLPRKEIVISSKVGYDLVPIPVEQLKPTLWKDPPAIRADFDYSRDAVMRSIEGSLKRLGTDYIDMLAIHD